MKHGPPGTHAPERRGTRAELTAMLHDLSINGIVVSGPVGSLKSELLASSIGPDFSSALHLLCSPVSVQSPFGALGPLLIDMESPPDELSVFRHLSHHLERPTPEDLPMMVIEEAQLLDAASAFILSQLALARRIKLVLLEMGEGHTEPVVASTELAARLGRISLGALSPSEISEYVRSILGAPATQPTEQAIAAVCAGNPVLIEAFIDAALSQEVLRESMGWFAMTQTHVENDETLSLAVSGLQKRLHESDAEALEILALGGAEEAALLAGACGTVPARLVGTGLATFEGHSRLRITAPLYAQVLRDLVPPGRSKQLWSKMASGERQHGTMPCNLLWAVENGAARSPREFLHAVEVANANVDFVAAWRLCRMSGRLASDPELVWQGATALVGLGQYELALREIGRGLELTEDPGIVLKLRSLAAAAMWQEGDPGEGLSTLVGEWADQCRHWQQQPGEQSAADVAQNVSAVASLGMWMNLSADQDPTQDLARMKSLEQGAAGSLERVLASDAKCATLLNMGLLVEVADEAMENLASVVADSGFAALIGYRVMDTALRALFAVGDYARVRAVISQHMPRNPRVYLHWAGAMHLWAAFAAIQEGRWQLVSVLLYEARAELSLHDPDRLLDLAEALCAYEQSQVRRDPSQTSPEETDFFRQREWAGTKNLDSMLMARAYHVVASSENTVEELERLVEQAQEARLRHTELQLLMLLWKQFIGTDPGRRALGRLRELCVPGMGRRDGLLLHAATLADTNDPRQLAEAADELYTLGETGLGAEVMAAALLAMNHARDKRQRGRLLRKLAGWVQELGGTSWSSLTEVLGERDLTARENEIIDLVRQGMSNKEIAEHLTVSERTVEGHLYRVFTKLGITHRDELGALS